jgi:ribonuclease P protein component
VRSEFTAVFEGGRRFAHPLLSLHWLRDEQPARLGLAVSRKVDPHAVGRNRIKRVLRDAFRRSRAQVAAGAYVVVARQAAAQVDGATLRAAFHSVLFRAGALPPSHAPGTMPHAGIIAGGQGIAAAQVVERQDVPPLSSMPRPRAG